MIDNVSEFHSLRLLAEAATPQPWHTASAHDVDCSCEELIVDDTANIAEVNDGRAAWRQNAALIVAAVNTFPMLLDVAEAADRLAKTEGSEGPCGDCGKLGHAAPCPWRALDNALAALKADR